MALLLLEKGKKKVKEEQEVTGALVDILIVRCRIPKTNKKLRKEKKLLPVDVSHKLQQKQKQYAAPPPQKPKSERKQTSSSDNTSISRKL